MNGVSLFSGVGGLDLGMHRAGVNIVAQCEQDPYRREVLARHWPDGVIFEDVSEVTGELVRTHIPSEQIDLVFGGFPCQDLSVAGRRAGFEGERSVLFFEAARIADALLGDGGWLLIENVPGLLSSNGGRDFAVLLATLAELGFHDLAWRVLDSRHFGVPQRRRRVFILARRARGGRAAKVLLEPEGGGGDFETGREARARAAADAGVSPALTRRYGKGTDSDATDTFVNALDRKGGGADDNDAQAGHLVSFRASGHAGSNGLGVHEHGDAPTLDREGNVGIVAGTVRSHPRPGSNDSGGIVTHTLRAEGFDASEEGTGRGTPLTVAPTLSTKNEPASSGDARIAWMDQSAREIGAVRRLTPSECEALQGFPRGWTLLEPDTDWRTYPQPDGRRYAACGDAVTVNVAEWIGRRIVERERVAA